MRIFYKTKECLKSYYKCEKGLALVEMAIAISLLLIMFIGSIEVTRYVMFIQGVKKTVNATAHTVAQIYPPNAFPPLNPVRFSGLLNNIMSTTPDIITMSLGNGNTYKGGIIITDIVNTGGTPKVNWQYCYKSGGTVSISSRITSVTGNAAIGTTANLSYFNNYTIGPNDEIIVGEMLYQYVPIFTGQNYVSPILLYSTALAVPSQGVMNNLVPTSPLSPSACP
jgi:competence protein ComGC